VEETKTLLNTDRCGASRPGLCGIWRREL